MNNVRGKLFLQRYSIALLFAFLVGALCVAPHVLAVQALGSSYQGYPFIYQDNEDNYMTRIQEIIDGHPSVGSPYLYEYKDEWPQILPVSEQLYALPTVLFHVPLTDTIVASKFILPAALFLLIYAFAISIGGGVSTRRAQWSAIATGLVVTLGYDIVDYAHLPALLSGTLGHTTLSIWTRPVNPVSGELLLVSLMLITWQIVTAKSRWWLPVVGGLLLGASISYFFSWFVGAAIVGLVLLYALYQKQWRPGLQLGTIVGLSLLLQIPYWYHTLQSFGSAAGKAAAMKNGAEFMHTPIINKFLLAISLVYLICLAVEVYKKRSIKKLELWWIFTSCLLLACWVAYNEQVITGMTVWPYHFVQYTIPISMIVFMVLGYKYVSARCPRIWNLFLGVVIAVSLWIGVASAQSYQYLLGDFLLQQSYMPAFSWLNNNTPVDCVVLVDEAGQNLARLVPAFTHCNTYVTGYVSFGVPDERIMHNYLVLLRLKNILPSQVRSYLVAHPDEVNSYFNDSIDQSLFTGTNAETQKNIDAIVPAYQDFYRNNFESELKQYRIDYFLTTVPGALPPGLTLIKETGNGAFTIYKLL